LVSGNGPFALACNQNGELETETGPQKPFPPRAKFQAGPVCARSGISLMTEFSILFVERSSARSEEEAIPSSESKVKLTEGGISIPPVLRDVKSSASADEFLQFSCLYQFESLNS
jgi:hypothetical protein